MSHPFWLAPAPLVLASNSAARRLLLEGAGLPVVVQPATLDERAIERPLTEAGTLPDAVALALARAKAFAVSALRPGAIVLGCDQTLSLGDRAFHKPDTLAAAADQLAALSGATHRLNSSAVLVRDGAVLFETVGVAALTMRPLGPAFIDRYLRAVGGGALDSVGAYKLEGLGVHLFDRIEGDQPTVMGLPLLALLRGMRDLGLVAG